MRNILGVEKGIDVVGEIKAGGGVEDSGDDKFLVAGFRVTESRAS